jgi:hypothetical protein
MSIELYVSFNNITFKGDGSATTFSVDLNDQIQQNPMIHNKTPMTIADFDGVPSPASASLAGTVVTFTFATAPPTTGHVDVSLLFPGT